MTKQAKHVAKTKQVAKSKPKSIVAVHPGTQETGMQENTDRHEMIAREAYFRAVERDFQGGDPVEDWLQAELKIDRQLNESKAD